MEYVVTLVHGTWARGARWTQPGSHLRRAIEESVPGPVTFEVFRWSGRNLIAARTGAAERLRQTLTRLLELHPAARHYIIGHSHGGNVALYALRDSPLVESIAGVACFSTPFLLARRRRFAGAAIVAAAVIVLALYTAVMIPVCSPIVEAVSRRVMSPAIPANGKISNPLMSPGFLIRFEIFEWLLKAALLPAFLAVTFVFFAIGQLFLNFFHWAEKALALPDLPGGRLFIIRARGDEVGAALGMSQILTWFTTRPWNTRLGEKLWRYLQQKWRRAESKPAGGDSSGCPSLAYYYVILALAVLHAAHPSSITLVILVIIALPAAFIVLYRLLILLPWLATAAPLMMVALPIAIVTTPIVFAVALLALPFGGDLVLVSPILEITAETAPLGSHTVHLVSEDISYPRANGVEDESARLEGPTLMHSATYEDPRALALLTDWIRSRDQPLHDG
jgi:pimeloyl-ACP methyl ester carboxylesterase